MNPWPMRQDPGQLTLCDQRLLTRPGDLDYVVVDLDDEWQLFSATPGHMASVCLEDVIKLMPQLTALQSLHAGAAANWYPGEREWLIGSLDPEQVHADEEDEQWAAASGLTKANPATNCFVTQDLVRYKPGQPDPFRFVFQISRYDDEDLHFFGWEDDSEGEEVVEICLRDVAILYPDVMDIVERPLQPGEEYVRTPTDRQWTHP